MIQNIDEMFAPVKYVPEMVNTFSWMDQVRFSPQVFGMPDSSETAQTAVTVSITRTNRKDPVVLKTFFSIIIATRSFLYALPRDIWQR